MTRLVLASVPIFGHVAPVANLAANLVELGHRVDVLTGSRFRQLVEAGGARFIPLPPEADFDDRTMNDGLDVQTRPGGIAGLRYDVRNVFLAPALAQHRALLELIDESVDAVVVDPTFVGAALLAAAPPGTRPAVVVAGVLPLPLDSVATPPFGLGLSPLKTPRWWERLRNRALRRLVQGAVFGGVQREYDRLFRQTTGQAAPSFVVSWMSQADHIVQLTVPSFEYPRPDARVPITYGGPVLRRSDAAAPAWLSELDPQRPTVLVTQGTIANRDLSELILPTIAGLADSPVNLIATIGRPITEEDALSSTPSNTRVTTYAPYDSVFPHVDVFITNGGYGGVQLALAHGVPVIVAGAGEDKPEVAARVAWSGVGLDLKTGRPRPDAIRRAVAKVLVDPAYRTAARGAAGQAQRADATAAVVRAASLARPISEVGSHGK